MNFELKTPPEAEPVTLAEAKAHMRIEHDADDTLITALIVAARQHAEDFTDRVFMPQEWYLYLDAEDLFSDCAGALVLRGCRPFRIPAKHPVTAVLAFEYQYPLGTWNYWGRTWDDGGSYDESGATFDQANYQFDQPSAKLFPVFGQMWPQAAWPYLSGYRITFAAGYAEGKVPEPIKLAIKTLVLHMYENREAYAEGNLSAVPAAFENLLWNYKLLNHAHTV